MLIVVTAAEAQAKAIKEQYKLYRIEDAYYTIYTNKEMMLIVTGDVKDEVIQGVSYIMGKAENDRVNKHIIFIDECIGISGGFNDGEICFVNQIYDEESGRWYYPDMLYIHAGIEISCITTGSTDTIQQYSQKFNAVDATASACFKSACRYFQTNEITIIRYVASITEKIRYEIIFDYINSIQNIKSKDFFTNREKALIYIISKQFRLTESQKVALRKQCISKKLRQQDIEGILELFKGRYIETTAERKKEYNELLWRLQ
jgi:hypothetical protein